MSRLTALVPITQGVALYAALRSAADTLVGAGSETRTRGQVMADTLVERVTGQAAATAVPITVNLLMTDESLLAGSLSGEGNDGDHDEPAQLVGGGPLPAPIARRLIRETDAAVFLRRVYTRPQSGELIAMENKARLFTSGMRRLLILRDRVCRTPWCDAPIRHADHIRPVVEGGATSVANGQGLCEACNHAKQAPDWHQRRRGAEVITRTPTGHLYPSQPPDPPCRGSTTSTIRLAELTPSAA